MRFQLKTSSAWVGTEQFHEIEGDFDTIEEALEAFGGDEEAYQQAIEDHQPSYEIEELDEDDY